MKTLVIKSNHGNHSGFNRKWTIEAKCNSLEEVQTELNNCADYLAEKYSISEEDRNELCGPQSTCFENDLNYYYIVDQDDYDNMSFFGDHRGYASQAIVDFFESED